MSAVTFDTHEFVKSLEAAGMPVAQAEALSVAMCKVQVSAEFATKADVAAVQADVMEVKADVKVLATKVDALGEKFDLLKWMLAGIFAAVMVPLIKALF